MGEKEINQYIMPEADVIKYYKRLHDVWMQLLEIRDEILNK